MRIDVSDDAVNQLPAVLGGFDLTDQARFAAGVPHEVFTRLRREAPVLFHPPGRIGDGTGFWVLSRHADIAAAAADPAFSAQGGGGRAGGGSYLEDLAVGVHAGVLLPMMDDPRHELVKRMVSPAVSAPAVAALETELRAAAAALVDEALARGGCDFAVDVSGPLAMRSVALTMGAPPQDWDQLVAWGQAVAGLVDRRSAVADENSKRTSLAIRHYAQGLLAAKRANPADDLASVMALGEISGGQGEAPLSEHEREANLILFFLTGNEQPRNTTAGGVLAFAQHPEQWQALRADRSLLPSATEEMLRWAPPNPYNRRTATRDLQFRDVRIRAGEKVTFWWASANRDESVFTDPFAFDIRRNPNPHLAFGHGRHFCMGDRLARIEMRVLLEELLDRVAEIRLAGPVTWAPSNKHAVVLDMPVELVPAARDFRRNGAGR